MGGVFWWSLRAFVTIRSLLTHDLKPTAGFQNQTLSPLKTDAFLLGEALTHWFAQTHLKANVVAPLEHHTGSLVMAAPGSVSPKTMPKYFRNTVALGAKSEPDFLGFSKTGEVHVLESKGRSGFGPKGLTQAELNRARNKALRQVCRIATVNGRAPVTRTACVFGFGPQALIGQITDPPETERFDYRVELPALIKQAYAVVLDPLFERQMELFGRDYLAVEFAPGWRFGVHKAVYERVRAARDDHGVDVLLGLLAEFQGEKRFDGDTRRPDGFASVGPDGLILSSEFEAF